MKLLLIPGYACDGSIFKDFGTYFNDIDIIEYDHKLTSSCANFLSFCNEVYKENILKFQKADVLVGHSMGSSVAFELSEINSDLKNKKVIFLDYFLQEPPEFFRNYVSQHTDHTIKNKVEEMVDYLRPKFKKELIETVPAITVSRLQGRAEGGFPKISVVYGMREETSVVKVRELLDLPDSYFNIVDFHYCPESAHFLTLEKPAEVCKIIKSIL